MPPAGDPNDSFDLNGREVTRRGAVLTLEDGTLAGSVLTMDAAVAYTVANLGIPLDEALRMGSLYPAQFLRLDRTRGRIAPRLARRSGAPGCETGRSKKLAERLPLVLCGMHVLQSRRKRVGCRR
jgi:hypothetical protein